MEPSVAQKVGQRRVEPLAVEWMEPWAAEWVEPSMPKSAGYWPLGPWATRSVTAEASWAVLLAVGES